MESLEDEKYRNIDRIVKNLEDQSEYSESTDRSTLQLWRKIHIWKFVWVESDVRNICLKWKRVLLRTFIEYEPRKDNGEFSFSFIIYLFLRGILHIVQHIEQVNLSYIKVNTSKIQVKRSAFCISLMERWNMIFIFRFCKHDKTVLGCI